MNNLLRIVAIIAAALLVFVIGGWVLHTVFTLAVFLLKITAGILVILLIVGFISTLFRKR